MKYSHFWKKKIDGSAVQGESPKNSMYLSSMDVHNVVNKKRNVLLKTLEDIHLQEVDDWSHESSDYTVLLRVQDTEVKHLPTDRPCTMKRRREKVSMVRKVGLVRNSTTLFWFPMCVIMNFMARY